jgi:hypothetical protein
MAPPSLLAAVLFSLALRLLAAEGKVHHHTWDIAYRYKTASRSWP